MGRPARPVELQGLIDGFIREEVLARDALALGLDRDDTIIRRRLVQKMNFLVEDLALLNEPTKADVSDYFEQHPELYRLPPVSVLPTFTSAGIGAVMPHRCMPNLLKADLPQSTKCLTQLSWATRSRCPTTTRFSHLEKYPNCLAKALQRSF